MSRSNCAIGRGYVPASFKGVLFDCVDADAEGGRRGAEGEFPFGEDTAYCDLGRKIRLYKLNAVFRDDDHVAASQALFQVCQSPGPGMLVHPTAGTVMVACRSVTVKDTPEEPGETHVSLDFVEANVAGGLGSLGNALFGIISTGLAGASQASFFAGYRAIFVPQPWQQDVIATAQKLVGTVATTVALALPADAPAQDWRNVAKMQEVATDAGLAAMPQKVDSALAYGFNAVAVNIQDASTRYTTMRKLANIAAFTSTLPAGAAQESEEAVLQRHRLLAAVGMAEAAMARKYATVDDALTTMDQVAAVFDDEAQKAYDECDNVLYLELEKYVIQFRTMMNQLAYRLPPVITVNFGGGVHPLVAAYAIYKDAKRHRELEPRNVIDANGRFGPLVTGIAPA